MGLKAVIVMAMVVGLMFTVTPVIDSANLTPINIDNHAGVFGGGFYIEYPEPTVDSIDPTAGLNTGIINVIITGINLRNSSEIVLKQNGRIIKAAVVKVIYSGRIACQYDLTGVFPGAYDVIVFALSDYKSGVLSILRKGFMIEYPAPLISGVEPDITGNGGEVDLKLNGSGFRPGARVFLENEEQLIEAVTVNVITPTSIVCRFDLNNVRFGVYDVKVRNDDQKSGLLVNGFRVGSVK